MKTSDPGNVQKLLYEVIEEDDDSSGILTDSQIDDIIKHTSEEDLNDIDEFLQDFVLNDNSSQPSTSENQLTSPQPSTSKHKLNFSEHVSICIVSLL